MTSSKTILVVDDDATHRSGLQIMLREKGFQTLEAEDGAEARDLIDRHHPDLVILDMMMPRWGGFAVLEHFQNNPNRPAFIMLTGHDGQKHKAYAKEVGAFDYLDKPCSMEHLLERIGLALNPVVPENKIEAAVPLLRVTCRTCGARVKAPTNMAGQTRPCPRCDALLVIREIPADEGPKLVMA